MMPGGRARFTVWGLGFGVSLKVSGLGFRVWGVVGFRA